VADSLTDYKQMVPRFDDWQQAGCFGYFGYGNGRSLVTGHEIFQAGGPAEMACTVCPRKQGCWDAMKAKACEVMPAAVECFEGLAAKHQGKALLEAWQQATRRPGDPPTRYVPDPYMALMLTNQLVGAEHSKGGDGG